MADIELVIKIDEKLYKDIYSDAEIIIYGGMRNGKTLLATLLRAIRNGTPLPKGHGRLIDADKTLKKHCAELCREKPSCHEDCLIYDLFHLAPTIIEADEAESEEENG